LFAIKRVLRYLSGTFDLALVYIQTGDPIHDPIPIFSDADWAGDTSDRHSYINYHSYITYLLGRAAISWRSQKQRMIALSIIKAEYVSFSKTAKEVAYLRSLMHEIGMEKYGEIILSVDNLGVLYIA